MRDELHEIHERVRRALRELARSRQAAGRAPVYLLEHGLTREELEALYARVASALKEASPVHERRLWLEAPLPLLIVMTEVGYVYDGPGHDYWPLLEKQLATCFSHAERRWLQGRFADQRHRLGLVAPPRSAWAEHFNMIAWPIANAILPRDLQAPFAACLEAVTFRVDEGTADEDITHALRAAATRASARLASWLQSDLLPATIYRHWHGHHVGSERLTQHALERIRADLERSQEGRAALARSRRLQRQGAAASISAQELSSGASRGALELRRQGDRLSLHLTFPPLLGGLSVDRAARRRYRPRLWGRSRPVRLEHLISGQSFSVDIERLPVDAPQLALLPDLAEAPVEARSRERLEALRVELSDPLIFKVDEPDGPWSDGESARQVTGASLVAEQTYWVATSSSGPPEATRLSDVGGLSVYCVQASASADWLRRHGRALQARARLRWLGAPPLYPTGSQRVFHVDDALFVEASRVPDGGVTLHDGAPGREVFAAPPGPALLRLDLAEAAAGEARVVATSQEAGGARQLRARLTRGARDSPVCSGELIGADTPDLSALLRGQLGLRVRAAAMLEGLWMTLRLEWGEAGSRGTRVTELLLAEAPCVVSADAPAWQAILDDDARASLRFTRSATLTATLGGLWSWSWRLEEPPVGLWWEDTPQGPALRSDDAALTCAVIPSSRPLATPRPLVEARSKKDTIDEPRLLVAYRPSSASTPHARDVLWGHGRCVSPRELHLTSPPRPARLLRGLDAQGEDAPGLEALTLRYLAWALADTRAPIEEAARLRVTLELERWLVEVTCGAPWSRREEALGGALRQEPFERFLRRCEEHGVGVLAEPRLNQAERRAFERALRELLEAQWPEVWEEAGRSTIDAERAEMLDIDVFIAAYERLREAALARGDEARAEALDVDVGAPPARWEQAFRAWRDDRVASRLLALVYPPAGREALSALMFERLAFEELVEELHAWRQRYRQALHGRLWSEDEVAVGLALWLNPARAQTPALLRAQRRLLVDQGMARAIRYVALRARAAGRESVRVE